MSSTDHSVPRATYRLQLTKDFTFRDALALVPYLKDLGVSHAYLSPILKAKPGSTHGYDGVDPRVINPELGTLDEFRTLAHALKAEGLGILADFVPNHMGVWGDSNPFWLDVLEWGQASPYADWFDINWSPEEPTIDGRLLAPVMGVHAEEALETGVLAVKFDKAEGSFAVWAHDTHKLPITPTQYGAILPESHPLTRRFAESTPDTIASIKAELARDTASHATIDARIAVLNSPEGRKQLRDLIDRQNWHVVHAITSNDQLNYRRFFTIAELAGLRIEDPKIFDAVHALIFSLVEEGLIDGIRIDHVDGLYDPKGYLLALRQKAPRPIYLVVEKILAPDEPIRTDWQVDGTTGYEFISLISPLLNDPQGEAPLDRLYRDFTGIEDTPEQVEYAMKLRIMDNELAAELDNLSFRLARYADLKLQTRDVARNALKRALREVVAILPVYRTYRDAGPLDPTDASVLSEAFKLARSSLPALDPLAFAILEGVMTGKVETELTDAARDLAQRIQQFSGPVMAKGLEDTALYRYNRLMALNEVGERPNLFSHTVETLHEANRKRFEATPNSMLNSSSHDTKRGEDARARLLALSGDPDGWSALVHDLDRILSEGGAPRIDKNEEYLFFQMLLGAWPLDLERVEGEALETFGKRLWGGLEKSLREAHVNSHWTAPSADHEGRAKGLLEFALKSPAFLDRFIAFSERNAPLAAANALIGTALRLLSPGVPDIYQGSELWDQSLVDPDNRRPVDFSRRRTLLARPTNELMDDLRSGSAKLALIRDVLRFRARNPELFSQGSYQPLIAEGPDADRIAAFIRRHNGQSVLLAAELYPWRTRQSGTTLDLPEGEWTDVLGNAPVRGGSIETGALFATGPVRILAQ
jgi:(1->4)-alpha-D-glucan 1-alpha-D-glucosylmutase